MPDYTIIGLAGYAGSGKDAIARRLPGYVRVAFADELKERAAFAVGCSIHQVEQFKKELRPLLVEIGRVAREFDPDYWVRYGGERLNRLRFDYRFDHFVFSDVRYLNEAKWIASKGGVTFYISRPNVGPANDEERDSIAELRRVLNPPEIRNDGTPEDAAAEIMNYVKGCVKV